MVFNDCKHLSLIFSLLYVVSQLGISTHYFFFTPKFFPSTGIMGVFKIPPYEQAAAVVYLTQ